MKKLFGFFGVFVCSVVAGAAWGEVPYILPLQGTLTDSEGEAVSDNVDFRVAVYDEEIGGAELWVEEQGDVFVSSGAFSIYLTIDAELADIIASDRDELWIGLGVNGESLGRTRLGSVLFAQEAGMCRRVGELEASQIQPALSGDNGCPEGQYLRGWDGAPLCSPDLDTRVSKSEVQTWAKEVCYDSPQEIIGELDGVCAPAEHTHVWADFDQQSIPAEFRDGDDHTEYEPGIGMAQEIAGEAPNLVKTFSVDFPAPGELAGASNVAARADHAHDADYARTDHVHAVSEQMLVVSKGEGGTYTTIQEAVDFAKDLATAQKPYLVKIEPGVYEGTVELAPNVHLVGSGESVTTIRAASGSDNLDLGAAVVTLANNTSLKRVRIENKGVNTYSIGLRAPKAVQKALVEDVAVAVDGSSDSNYGVWVEAGVFGLEMSDVAISVFNGKANNVGILSRGNLEARRSRVVAYGSDGSNVGIHNGDGAAATLVLKAVDVEAGDGAQAIGLLNDTTASEKPFPASLRDGVIQAHDAVVSVGIENNASLDVFGTRAVAKNAAKALGIRNAASARLIGIEVAAEAGAEQTVGVLNDGELDRDENGSIDSGELKRVYNMGPSVSLGLFNSKVAATATIGEIAALRSQGHDAKTQVEGTQLSAQGPACAGVQIMENTQLAVRTSGISGRGEGAVGLRSDTLTSANISASRVAATAAVILRGESDGLSVDDDGRGFIDVTNSVFEGEHVVGDDGCRYIQCAMVSQGTEVSYNGRCCPGGWIPR